MELYVTDEVEEQFELCGESTPYLQSRALREERMATPVKDAELLSGTCRHALGHFLMSAISLIWTRDIRGACPQKVWFDGMHMCDVLAARGLNFADQATSHAIAVLRVLSKAEDATRSLPSDRLSATTEVLRRHGAAMQPALPEDIDSAERRILRCLGWQIWSPSLHSWLSAFLSRLRVLSKQYLTDQPDFEAVLMQLWRQTYTCGSAVVMHVASIGWLAPRSSATGLLGLGCVRAGVLPLHDARPEWLGAAEWEQAYVRAMGPVPAFKAGSDAVKITQILQLATDSSMVTVKDTCGRVALVLPDANGPMQGAREPVAL
jgi:hypothetical protein